MDKKTLINIATMAENNISKLINSLDRMILKA